MTSSSDKTFTPTSLATLRSHFLDLAPSLHGSKWDELWSTGFSPWDRGQPNPALVDVLTERRRDLFGSAVTADGERKKALVPGCGKGYDVLLFSAFGYDAYGLELSENALQGAKEVENDRDRREEYAVRDEKLGRGKVDFLVGDFFKTDFLKSVPGAGKFDVIYDYTFLCALPPVLRPAWAQRYSQLLAPGGRLICLEFPSTKPVESGGPPYALPAVVYEAHLPRPGQELPYDEAGNVEVSKLGEEAREGLVRLAHFQPKRTFKEGLDENGKVLDWVGVWGPKEL